MGISSHLASLVAINVCARPFQPRKVCALQKYHQKGAQREQNHPLLFFLPITLRYREHRSFPARRYNAPKLLESMHAALLS
jgi:hypothetical protein